MKNRGETDGGRLFFWRRGLRQVLEVVEKRIRNWERSLIRVAMESGCRWKRQKDGCWWWGRPQSLEGLVTGGKGQVGGWWASWRQVVEGGVEGGGEED